MPAQNAVVLDLDNLSELFKSPDPNPFSARAVDTLGESGMDRVVKRVLRRWPWGYDVSRITLRLPPDKITPTSAQEARDAVRRYCAAQEEAQHIARQADQTIVRYQTRIALVTLAATIVALWWTVSAPNAVLPDMVRGFVFIAALFTFAIAGWDAATWLLFNWVPFVREARLYRYIGAMNVEVEARAA